MDTYIEETVEQDCAWTPQSLNEFLMGRPLAERATDYCGRHYIKTTVEGGMSIGTHRCGNHRACQFCYTVRRNEFESRLSSIEKQDTIAIICTEDEAKKITRSRRVSSDDYLRSPLEDGMIIIAISKELVDTIKKFEYTSYTKVKDEDGNVNSMILDAFADLPYGKRTSGELGKMAKEITEEYVIPKPIDESDTVKFLLPRYLADSTNDSMISGLFMDAVVQSSANGIPQTADDVTTILDNRFSAFESLMRKNNIDFLVIRRVEVVVSLKHMLENVFIAQHNQPNVEITLNIRIGESIQPVARSFKECVKLTYGAEYAEKMPTS